MLRERPGGDNWAVRTGAKADILPVLALWKEAGGQPSAVGNLAAQGHRPPPWFRKVSAGCRLSAPAG